MNKKVQKFVVCLFGRKICPTFSDKSAADLYEFVFVCETAKNFGLTG